MLKGFALKELRQALFIKDLQDQIDEAKGQFHLMIDIKIIDEILFQYNFLDEGFDAAHKVQTCGELADDINKFIQNLIVDTRTVELDLVAPLNPLYIEEQLVQSYQKLQSRSSSLDQLGKHNRHHFGCHNHYTVGKALKDNQLDTFKLLAQLKRDNSKLKSVNYRLKSKHLDATIFLERQQMQLKINELEAQNAQLQTFNLNLHEKVKLFQKQNDELSHKAFFYKNQLDLLENNRTDRTVLDKYIGILLSKNTQELGPQEITQLRGLISSSQGLVYANEDSNSAGDSRGGSRCGSALSGIQGSIQEIRSQYLRQRAINDELVTYLQKAVEELYKKDKDKDTLLKLEEKLFQHQFQLSNENQSQPSISQKKTELFLNPKNIKIKQEYPKPKDRLSCLTAMSSNFSTSDKSKRETNITSILSSNIKSQAGLIGGMNKQTQSRNYLMLKNPKQLSLQSLESTQITYNNMTGRKDTTQQSPSYITSQISTAKSQKTSMSTANNNYQQNTNTSSQTKQIQSFVFSPSQLQKMPNAFKFNSQRKKQ
eukprot:403377532